ncbi:TRAP transporter large permease [Moorella sp. E306M]|uniref:TRAP transporter large permease n=1 Tax=Moorella sp. E306M TaxID=2572683 RepID=UPI0010FFC305|nr:TRAP transporter large permease [Moorella sp. E306M]GEA19141.1 C4-dicarboxylate ABC transporter [Moorella sp. E306M]
MLLVVLTFVILLLLNVPIAFTLGIAGIMYFLTQASVPLPVVVQRMITGTQSYPLLAVPFFILAGHIMNASGITSRLMKLADALTGHMAGGLAQASIVLSMLMGGVSGSSNADVAMETRILLPEMRKKRYSDGFSAAVLAFGSLTTAIIPPSIGLVLYGFVGQVSIGKLLMAGIIPGILMGLVMMFTTYLYAKKRGYDTDDRIKRKSFGELIIAVKDSIWALLFPVILVVTIRFGIFTATEASAFAVVYAFLVGKFIYRELDWVKLKASLKDSAEDNAMILLIISMAAVVSYVLAYEKVPVKLASFIVGISENPYIIMGTIIVFLLIAGMLMEGTVNILLLTPIFLPIITKAGFDPVHFGIIMAIMVQIGGVTPPVGVNMYTVCSLGNIPIENFVKESLPYLLALIIIIIIIVAFPQISLFLPGLIR